MKTFFTLLFSLSLIAFGQTKLIAYKSHSGNMANFSVNGFDNVGMPPIEIDSIILLNDSTIVEIRSANGMFFNKDTVVNHPICKIPHLTVDTLKGLYYRTNIEFVGFDTVLTKKEIKRQQKWYKSQEKLKKKRAKVLKKYNEIDEKIISNEKNTFGDINNNSTAEVKKASFLSVTNFGLLIITFVVVLFLMIWQKNKNNISE